MSPERPNILRRAPVNGWYIQATASGIMICRVYRGQFGCRLWTQETLGL